SFLYIDPRKHSGNLTDLLPTLELSPRERVKPHRVQRLRHPELAPNLRSRFRHHRREQRGSNAQRLSRRVQREIEHVLRLRIFRQLPGRLLHDEPVDGGQQSPDSLQSPREFKFIEQRESGFYRLEGRG